MNDSLRQVLADADLDERAVARHLGVVSKTVERWVAGRVPYPRHRSKLADLLGVHETELWPEVSPNPYRRTASEIRATYPHRWAVPRHVWHRLFESATRDIGVLVYAGLFLAEDLGSLRLLAHKADAGIAVRILLGDPEAPQVADRGTEEGVDHALAAKIRNALVLYRPLRAVDGVEIRLHRTVLYTSMYRADDELLVNPHAYGVPASHAPVLHLRKTSDGDMASMYTAAFERVWTDAAPLPGQ